MSSDAVGEQLVRSGQALVLATRGRRTGATARAVVSFVEEPDGSLLVAASDPGARWAQNLLADAHCAVTLRDVTFPALAERLEEPRAGGAVRELILKYGTPSERLGAGPIFRLSRDVPAGDRADGRVDRP